jgi:hypothetical protein
VPAPRLLILADPKMLPALAGGLREGGRFDVTAVPLADPAAAQAAAERAEALAVFYGAAAVPLSAALQALAPKLRERGGRVVAVLQREQVAQRDECFRAGASDLLFMPMPRDQFVARLSASVGLGFAQEAGVPATVAVATRSSTSRLDRATVSAAGVESPAQLALKAGETVRLSWGAFQSWGLVVRGAPSAQIRFAGLGPDEEATIREWVRSGARQPLAASAPLAQPRAPAQAVPAHTAAGQPAPVRTAPGAGPPPGFVDRKQARPPARAAPRPNAVSSATPPAGSPPVARSITPRATPAVAAHPPPQNGSGGLEILFDGDGAAPAPPAVTQRPAPPQGPPWPAPVSAAVCRAAATQLLTNDTVRADVPPNVAASARKIMGMLSLGERAWIERTGTDSHFADALAARIALDVATSEGTRLASAGSNPVVDAESLAAFTKIADEAAARLQKEANAAIGKGEVESLQLVTAASASLSRDLLNLKETADRLRGVGAAPRLGAGALDPEVVLPGQQPRPRPPPGPQTPAPVKAELRDFRGLDHKPGRGKGVIAFIIVAAAIGLAVNAFYFSVPRQREVAFESAGRGVQGITITGASAVVTVTPDWLAAADANLVKLVQVLRANQVKKALLMLPNGSSAGLVDVASGRASGMPAPK